MAELKTKKTNASVEKFLNAIEGETRRDDCYAILEMMKKITRAEPAMWGSSIVGFGTYHYIYASGQEGDWPMIGFSPRKQNLTLYIMPGFEKNTELIKKLGKCKTAKSCIYIKRLDDIHLPTLKQLFKASLNDLKKFVAANKIMNQKKKK
jgi:hypothetical protein